MPKSVTRNQKSVVKNQKELTQDPYFRSQGRDLLTNASAFQRRFFNMFLDRRRKIEKECGYPETEELLAEDYKKIYEREPLAARVVDILPAHCWRVQPTILETEDIDQETEFEKAWKDLSESLEGGSKFFSSEEQIGNPIWDVLERVDKLCGIGHYGVLLLGVNQGKLEDPLILNSEGYSSKQADLLYVRPLDETFATIRNFETDSTNPRYGMPKSYTVSLEINNQTHRGINTQAVTTLEKEVHWTRIVHISDNLESGRIFGAPRMRTLYNRLYDLFKLYGGSAEMFWMAAFFGLSFETHPQLGGDVEIDKADTKQQMENYFNSLQRYLALPGMSVKALSPTVSDPTSHIDAQIEAICIHLGVPKRIFMGSERGELSSGQDARSWDGVVQHRQNSFVTPRIIVPFISRLIQIGVLPVPQEGFKVVWPELTNLTETEKSDIAVKRTDAMVKYIQGDVESLIDPQDFLVRVLGIPREEAIEIIEARETTDLNLEEELPEMEGLEVESPDPEKEEEEQDDNSMEEPS